MFGPLAVVCILLGLRQLLRNQWIAAAVLIAALGLLVGNGNDPAPTPRSPCRLGFLFVAGWMFLVLRFGVLALVASAFVTSLLEVVAITTDFSRWYAPSGVVALATIVGLAAYATRNTLASRPGRSLRGGSYVSS